MDISAYLFLCLKPCSVKTLDVPVGIERTDHLELKLQPW